jgi:hypothetical protein
MDEQQRIRELQERLRALEAQTQQQNAEIAALTGALHELDATPPSPEAPAVDSIDDLASPVASEHGEPLVPETSEPDVVAPQTETTHTDRERPQFVRDGHDVTPPILDGNRPVFTKSGVAVGGGAAPVPSAIPQVGGPAPQYIPTREPRKSLSWDDVVNGRTLAAAGGLLVAVGLCFLMVIASQEGYFPFSARLALGSLVSVLCVAGGAWLQTRRPNQPTSAGLFGAGIVGLFASLAAAGASATISDGVALGGMLGASVLAGGSAHVWRHHTTAVIAVLGGLIAPLIVDVDANTTLFGFYGAGLFLVGGIIAATHGWRGLAATASLASGYTLIAFVNLGNHVAEYRTLVEPGICSDSPLAGACLPDPHTWGNPAFQGQTLVGLFSLLVGLILVAYTWRRVADRGLSTYWVTFFGVWVIATTTTVVPGWASIFLIGAALALVIDARGLRWYVGTGLLISVYGVLLTYCDNVQHSELILVASLGVLAWGSAAIAFVRWAQYSDGERQYALLFVLFQLGLTGFSALLWQGVSSTEVEITALVFMALASLSAGTLSLLWPEPLATTEDSTTAFLQGSGLWCGYGGLLLTALATQSVVVGSIIVMLSSLVLIGLTRIELGVPAATFLQSQARVYPALAVTSLLAVVVAGIDAVQTFPFLALGVIAFLAVPRVVTAYTPYQTTSLIGGALVGAWLLAITVDHPAWSAVAVLGVGLIGGFRVILNDRSASIAVGLSAAAAGLWWLVGVGLVGNFIAPGPTSVATAAGLAVFALVTWSMQWYAGGWSRLWTVALLGSLSTLLVWAFGAVTGQVAVSLLFAIVGCALIGAPQLQAYLGSIDARRYGLGLLALLAAKVVLYDLTTLDALARVVSSVGVGLLLLLAAWWYSRLTAPMVSVPVPPTPTRPE